MLKEVVQLGNSSLNDKNIQVALRQLLGVYATTDRNFRNLFSTLSEGISLGVLISCAIGIPSSNLYEIPILQKCLPYILKLCEVVAFEMNKIVHDDNLDQVTVLAAKILESIIQSQQTTCH